ncbi:MAG TPA: heterodisulfide reductase-related iron-sulfur binding cluster [Rhizomicrobium sp.]|nr:heterodisulfide reductase-related iron-sulfur binding cluster [Rhizomicrobium sp.]
MAKEGSLQAPVRHAIAWRDPDFYDEKKLDAEMRRVFEICHGCRRCFNLCESFPRLFDLIDASPDEVHGVKSVDFGKVVEACTLCDMCFLTKCPYVPPHQFDLDFPHLMLRYRAVEAKKGKTEFTPRQLAEMDRNGRLAKFVSPVVNWAGQRGNALTRPVMEKTAGIDRDAALPAFAARTFMAEDRHAPVSPNRSAPAFGKRKAAIYATCFVNYNKPGTGLAARAVLNHLGVETRAAYPGCCGMPLLEQAELDRVAANAAKVAHELMTLADEGFDIVALTASCGLMLKFEWPLILPENVDVQALSRRVFDINEYVVDIAKKEGLPGGMKALPEGVAVHIACHERAQVMGQKSAEMLKLIPDTPVDVVERCSGHGGTFGVMKKTHAAAVKVGRPVFRTVANAARGHVVSSCPLAAQHIVENVKDMAAKDGKQAAASAPEHPIEILAKAYGLV